MGQVTVTINGRGYTVGCDNGQEDHIAELAGYLDHHIGQLKEGVGPVGDMRLLLLAGIMVADELSETVAKLEELVAEVADLRSGQSAVQDQASDFEAQAVEVIDGIASRIEVIAGRLNAS